MTVPDQTTERRYCLTHKTEAVDICGDVSNLPCDIRALVPVERREAEQAALVFADTLAKTVERLFANADRHDCEGTCDECLRLWRKASRVSGSLTDVLAALAAADTGGGS